LTMLVSPRIHLTSHTKVLVLSKLSTLHLLTFWYGNPINDRMDLPVAIEMRSASETTWRNP
jgi:hypothetical protein